MQLYQLVLVTAFALWCCCSSTNAEPLGLGINNNPSGLRRFTPLLLRLLRAFRDTNDGYADGVVDDQAATGSTTKAPKYTDSWWPNREQRTITSRQSMECWCAVENCNCDSARIHDGCVELSATRFAIRDHQCPLSQVTPSSAFSCASDGPLEIVGTNATVIQRLPMECWCGIHGNCLCGNEQHQQRTFKCSSVGDHKNTPL